MIDHKLYQNQKYDAVAKKEKKSKCNFWANTGILYKIHEVKLPLCLLGIGQASAGVSCPFLSAAFSKGYRETGEHLKTNDNDDKRAGMQTVLRKVGRVRPI